MLIIKSSGLLMQRSYFLKKPCNLKQIFCSKNSQPITNTGVQICAITKQQSIVCLANMFVSHFWWMNDPKSKAGTKKSRERKKNRLKDRQTEDAMTW